MKSLDKLKEINEKIDKINNNILVHKNWKFAYSNKGANNYCLVIQLGEEELFVGAFATYGSVISALDTILYMFNKELDERQRVSVKGKEE